MKSADDSALELEVVFDILHTVPQEPSSPYIRIQWLVLCQYNDKVIERDETWKIERGKSTVDGGLRRGWRIIILVFRYSCLGFPPAGHPAWWGSQMIDLHSSCSDRSVRPKSNLI